MDKIWAINESSISLAKKISAMDETLLDTNVKSNILTLEGNTAIITIKGTLGFTASLLEQMCGVTSTSYEDITRAIEWANASDAVDRIVLAINSGGGIVSDSMWTASDAIYNSKKPVTAHASDYCCSAAYLLASQASNGIVARHHLTSVGSIGCMAIYDKHDANAIVIRSSNASLKNADPAQQPEQYQAQVDAVETEFISHISRSLSLTNEKIVSDFGEGATITALEALKKGMIKEIYNPHMFGKKEQDAGELTAKVDIEQIKAEHYQSGVIAERARVAMLNQFSAKYAAPEAAAKAIAEGLSVQDCMEAMLEEQKRNLTAKALHNDVEAVAITDTAEKDLETDNLKRNAMLKEIGAI